MGRINHYGELNCRVKCQVRDILTKFQMTFNDLPGVTDIVLSQIKLTANELIRTIPHAVPYSIRESLKKDFSRICYS